MSTGESEFYTNTEGSARSLHSQAILKGFGVSVEAVVLSDASAGIGIASRQGCGGLMNLEVKWLWVQEKVSEKALRLKKRPTETSIADLATKYLSRSRMEVLLAAGNLVLVSGESETSGEYILMNFKRNDSEVKRFLFIVMLFLCVGGVLIGVFYCVITDTTSMLNRTVSCVTALRVGTLVTGWTRGSRTLELEMDLQVVYGTFVA